MEVSLLLCYGGISNIPGHPSNSITHCSSVNNSKSIQIASCISLFPLSSSSRSIPAGHVTYTHAWHLVMSLHGICVTQHHDSLRKITFVLDREKLPLPGVFDFSLCYLLSVGAFSCGQHGCSVPATLYVHRQICWQLTASSCTHSGFLCFFLSFPFLSPTPSFVASFLTLYLIPSVSIPASTLHLPFPIPLSPCRYLSLCQGANVGLQMKQLDLHLRLPAIDTCCSVSGRTLCLSDALTRENGQANETPSIPHKHTRHPGSHNSPFLLPIFTT